MDNLDNPRSFSSRNVEIQQESKTNWSLWAPVTALAVGLIAITIFAFNEHSRIDTLNQQAAAHSEEISSLQTRMAAADSALSGTVGNLQDELANAGQKTAATIAKAQSDAARHADLVAQALKKNIDQQSSEEQEALNAEIAGVKNATSDASSRIDGAMSKIDGVNNDVTSVKTDLASTRTSIDSTSTDLQRARGDMGVMSGLIATNSKEIRELRDMGDRNIYEFTIAKGSGMQKVGDVQMRLTKSDPKHSLYTMVVFANDKMIEKKDKTSNEPVQFYVGTGARTPYELVVNDVSKDTIKGYLATPKVATASK